MARRKTEGIKIDPALFRRDGASVTLTQDAVTAYLSMLRAQGRSGESLRSCEAVLGQFMAFLPEGRVTRASLPTWRERLLSEGYAVRTVNSRVSTVNALLTAMDCRDFQVDRQLPTGAFTAPELTRQEYLKLLLTELPYLGKTPSQEDLMQFLPWSKTMQAACTELKTNINAPRDL